MAQSIIQEAMQHAPAFARLGAKGQQEFIGTSSASFTVPAGVSLLSAVCVGYAAVVISGSAVCASGGSYSPTGDGGGNGGVGGAGGIGYSFPSYPGAGAGGGAGGYSGDGGGGSSGATQNEFTLEWVGPFNGGNGSGGGGGGGGGGPQGTPAFQAPGYGGGVGLLGQGSSGSGGSPMASGTAGSASGGTYGGGIGGTGYGADGYPGANLRWKNNIAVTPGQTFTIYLAAQPGIDGPSAVRVMWGGGRSYPSNAGNV